MTGYCYHVVLGFPSPYLAGEGDLGMQPVQNNLRDAGNFDDEKIVF